MHLNELMGFLEADLNATPYFRQGAGGKEPDGQEGGQSPSKSSVTRLLFCTHVRVCGFAKKQRDQRTESSCVLFLSLQLFLQMSLGAL